MNSRTVLQISDCHLVRPGATLLDVDTQASLEAVLSQALARRTPDAIVASGDLAHDPVRDVYARFLDTIRGVYDGPLMCLPGNHDVLAMMQAGGLPLQPLTLAPWSLLPLDSHEDEVPESDISAADRRQVAEAVAASGQPNLLLVTHHPLVAVDCPWLDKDRIKEAEELLTWLQSSEVSAGRLRGVVFGHAHQVVEGCCAQLPVYGVPSTCFQFKPRSQKFAVDELGPGYRWLFLHSDGTFTTETERLDSWN